MKIICAWCDKDMGTKDGQGQEGTTHGICPECKEQQLAIFMATQDVERLQILEGSDLL